MSKNDESSLAGKRTQALHTRLAPPLLFIVGLCLLVMCCYDPGYSALPPTEKRYAAAKESAERLRLDEKRAGLREPWETIAREVQSIYQNDPKWPNRPAALFRAAETLEELARRSFAREDVVNAVKCYEQVAQRHADSRLADDALYCAARLRAAWLKDDKGALALIARMKRQYPDGDMLPQALAMEKALRASANGKTTPEARKVAQPVRSNIDDTPPPVVPALSAEGQLQRYRAAKDRMAALRNDNVRSCQRQPWENLRDEFLTLQKARNHPVIGPASAFRAASCQEELARCSHLSGEFRRAVELYLAVPATYPKSALSDDALLAAARIQAENLGNKSAAAALLDRQIRDYPGGDMKEKAVALRNGLFPPAVASLQKTVPTPRVSLPVRDAARENLPEVQTLSWDSPGKNSVEIVLELSGPATYGARLVKGKKNAPDRILIEIDGASVVKDVRRGVTVRGSLLQAVRVRDSGKGPSLQFEFRDVRRYDVRSLRDPFRIVLSVAAGKTPLPRGTEGPAYAGSDAAMPRHTLVRAGRANLVSQLGLSVGRVVIDAGHGGRDPGTQHNNLTERVITLDVAMTLGRLLADNGLEVVYTRTRDTTLSLSSRTEKANAARGDVFVSIHVNASPSRSANGFETYFLDMTSNPQAAHVAALENARSDRRIGDLQDILADVMLSARQEESRRLAGDIQRLSIFRLKKRGFTVKNNGARSAPFHVLLGANMPAVLVELGYCTNPAEARLLLQAKYRLALAEGIAEGILAYKNRLQKRRTAENALTGKGADAM
mgnify:FL=1